MKKFFFMFFLIIAMLNSIKVSAQEYDSGIGFRAGLNPGITGKIFMARHSAFKNMKALEGIVAIRFKGVAVTSLFEFHKEVFDTKGLYLYFGGGIHVAFWNSDEVFWETDNTGMQTYAGIDGIIGMEYVVQDFPLTFGMDWKPNLNFIGDNPGIIDDIAVSVRYYFD